MARGLAHAVLILLFLKNVLVLIVYLLSSQITACFGIALRTEKYIGYAVLSLVVEINSIFLHIRQLLPMVGFPKSSPSYRLNGLLNLGKIVPYHMGIYCIPIYPSWQLLLISPN